MKTIKITSKEDELLVLNELPDEDADKDSFDLITPDYMVRIERNEDKLKAINAVDGWGNNCKELFKDSVIYIY